MNALSFLNPWLLAGLALAALPILIHLFDRRRLPEQALPTLRFLMQAREQVKRRIRLRDALLLAARVLALALLALLVAHPILRGDGPVASAGAHGPRSIIFILDGSFGMHYRIDKETLFERAKQRLAADTQAMGPGDEAALVVCDDRWRLLTDGFQPGDVTRRAAGALAPEDAAIRWSECLRGTLTLLNKARNPAIEIRALTNLAAAGWENAALPEADPERPVALHVIDVAGRELPNRSVLAASLTHGYGSLGERWSASIRAGNYGAAAEGIGVRLRTADGNSIAEGFFDWKAPGTQDKIFDLTAPGAEYVNGKVVLEADNLPEDDEFAFQFYFGKPLRVLIIDGAPGTFAEDSASYFVDTALRPGPTSSAINPQVLTRTNFVFADLAGHDVLMLLNVGNLAPDSISALEKFVRAGGGIFWSMGDHVGAAEYGRLGSLMPGRFRTVRDMRLPGSDGVTLKSFPSRHAMFQDLQLGNLATSRVDVYVQLEQIASNAQVLLEFSDGAPALISTRLGQGRILWFASSLDASWSNLPYRPFYLPLLQQSVRYLGGTLGPASQEGVRVGGHVNLNLRKDIKNVRIEAPDGRSHNVPVDGERALFTETRRAGLHRVWGENDLPMPEANFIIVRDPEASDLARLAPVDLEARLQNAGFGGVVEGVGGSAERTVDPILPLLGVLALLLLGEARLARRGA
jgi:hypothetical protein